MIWVIIVFLILFIVLIVVLVTKLKVFINYYHGQDNDHLIIEFKAWHGLIKYKINVPMIKVDDNSPTIVAERKIEKGQNEKDHEKEPAQISGTDVHNYLKDTKELVEHVFGLHSIIRHFLKKVSLSKIEWHTAVGINNAAHTGVLAGAIWAVKGSIIGVISSYLKLKEMPNMTVTPIFQGAFSMMSFSCMIQFRIGHAMFAGIKLMKFWKGGRARFRTKPLSVLSGNKSKSV